MWKLYMEIIYCKKIPLENGVSGCRVVLLPLLPERGWCRGPGGSLPLPGLEQARAPQLPRGPFPREGQGQKTREE
jgi:hypothetical protein